MINIRFMIKHILKQSTVIMQNQEYFQTVHTEVRGLDKFSVIQVKGYPMLLFSKVDNMPLAGIHMRSHTANTIITKAPHGTEVEFQGIIDKDNQEFELNMINLTGYYLNFNIIKDGKTNINRINCLQAHQSYAVKCDQETDCVLVLSSVKDEKKNKVTVEEKSKNPEYKKLGTVYYISIVPENKKEIVDRFKETYWACVDSFCMKTKIEPARPASGSLRRDVAHITVQNLDLLLERGERLESGNVPFNALESQEVYRSCHSEPARGRSEPARGHSEPARGRGGDIIQEAQSRREQIVEAGTEFVDQLDSNIIRFSDPHQQKEQINILERDRVKLIEPESEQVKVKSSEGKRAPVKVENLNDETVKKSYVGEVKAGRKIKESSRTMAIEFDYTVTSPLCRLGLSINETMVFVRRLFQEEYKDWNNEAKKMIEEFVKNESTSLLEKINKIYTANECVICLADEKPIDTVYYQCGHKCCHKECGLKLIRCPVCRTVISATIITPTA
jgi:hypothetical protein